MSPSERDQALPSLPWVIVGAGRAGQLMGLLGRAHGESVLAVWSRSAQGVERAATLLDATPRLGPLELEQTLPELDHGPVALWLTVVDDAIEAAVRESARALKTPGFLFFHSGRYLGAIEKIRDWDDYMGRVSHILGLAEA